MKKKLILAMSLIFLGNFCAFAQEKDKENIEKNVEETQNLEKTQESLEEKLAKSHPKKIKVYEFNPVKNPKGIVTFIEFNDLSCKECLNKSNEIYNAIGEEMLQDMKIVYKHIQEKPNALVNKHAFYGALANKYGKFWEMKEHFRKKDYTEDDQVIDDLLKMGLKQNALFDVIMNSGDTFYKHLDVDAQYGMSLKSHASPMFFIDGYRLEEDISLQEMIEYIKLKKQDWLLKKEQLENKYKVGKL